MERDDLPLQGIRILEFGQLLAIPHAVKLLADMGAEVIKIESCVRLNFHRASSFVANEPGEAFWNRAANYNDQNRNKMEITLDLTKPKGVEIARALVKISDVVCENFASRVMRNFGLDYESLKMIRSDIIMLSSTGYGHTGPWADYIAAGSTTEPASGLLSITGYPDALPRPANIPYTDYVGAEHGAFAIMAALHYRQLTGRGQWIDLAQSQAGSCLIGEVLLDYLVNGRVQTRMGNKHPYLAPQGCYPCLGDDKWITIAVSCQEEWQSLCHVMHDPAWCQEPMFADPMSRHAHQDELDRHLAQWTSRFDHYELMHLLQQAGVPAGAVLTNKELLQDPHYQSRNFYQMLDHPAGTGIGRRPYPGVAWKLSRTPGSIRTPAPTLGQDNAYVLQRLLGFSPSDIDELAREGIIGTVPTRTSPPRVVPLETQKQNGTIADYDTDYEIK